MVVGWILVTHGGNGGRRSFRHRHGVGVKNGVKRGSEADCRQINPDLEGGKENSSFLGKRTTVHHTGEELRRRLQYAQGDTFFQRPAGRL